MAIADILKGAYNYATGKGVLGNVMDYGAGALAANKAQYAEHTNAVGKNVFGTKPTVSYGAIGDDAALATANTRKLALDNNKGRTPAEDTELKTLDTNITDYTTKKAAFDTQTKAYNSQQDLMKQLTGEVPLPKDKTQAQVLEEAMTAGTINQEQKSALDYFMVQNKGQAYTEGSIDKAFQARDTSVKDKFQTTSATLLETPTSFPGLASADDNSTMSQLKGLGIGAAIGGIAGAALYENPEEGMVYGLAGAGLARGVTRAVKNNLDSITAYGMKSVLGDQLVKEGDKVGYGIDAATKAKMKKLGVTDADKLNVDVTTGKVTQAGKDFDLEAQRKNTEVNATKELTMEDIGFGDKVANKDVSVQNFTKTLIDAEEQALTASVNTIKTDTNISSLMTSNASNDVTHSVGGYNINVKKDAQLTEDMIKQQVVEQNKANLAKANQNLLADPSYKTNKAASDKTIFENEMKSQALTKDGAKNASLLEDQAKAAHAAIFKPQKNVAVTKDQADTMNLNNLKSKKESDLGAVQNIAKNMLTNPGGAGKLTGQYRNMILGGAALSGVAFTSNKRDYRRGINSNRGNRI